MERSETNTAILQSKLEVLVHKRVLVAVTPQMHGTNLVILFVDETMGEESKPSRWVLQVATGVWRLESSEKFLAGYGDVPKTETTTEELKELKLRDLLVESIVVDHPSLETHIHLEGGLTLHIFPTSYSRDWVHWKLTTPEQKVLTVGPGSGWSWGVREDRKS